MACPKRCRHCDVELPYEKRKNDFCNRSCSASQNNLGVRRYGKLPKGKYHRDLKFCLICDKQIDRHAAKCCSRRCHADLVWRTTKNDILETGRIPTNRKYTAKRYLSERDGYCCKLCGINEWAGKRLLCPNCDSLTSTYKGRNRGHGRHSRRLRYQQGKSY